MNTRRDLLFSIPALTLLANTLAAQTNDAGVIASGTETLQHNTVFNSQTLPIHTSANDTSQAVVQGKLPTSEFVELHNTTLMPGHAPHPPHQHKHSEFLLIREGTVDWMVGDQRVKAGPGDILFAASMQMHGVRNVGTTVAKYFVVAVGAQT